ncbi:MAG: hypothetical protein BCS36_11555 [Desulfovibrio sp. MES5]|nr:MAG: hypothetical protein BCS36_11555 [Desulfovibrio sp. MES5]
MVIALKRDSDTASIRHHAIAWGICSGARSRLGATREAEWGQAEKQRRQGRRAEGVPVQASTGRVVWEGGPMQAATGESEGSQGDRNGRKGDSDWRQKQRQRPF